MKPYQLLKKLINYNLKPITSNQNQEAIKMKPSAIFKLPLTLNLSARGGSDYVRKPLTLISKRRKTMKAKIFFAGLLFAVIFLTSLSYADVPQMINYQGTLYRDGVPVDEPQTIRFSIYDAEIEGNLLWTTEPPIAVEVEDGIFSVLLPVPFNVFDGNRRWLGITIITDPPEPEMTPRREMVSVPYAYRSATGDNDWTFRITGGNDTTLITGGEWGIARSGNVLHGNGDHTHVNLGDACTTGTSGQSYEYCTVGGGQNNTASGAGATVGGGGANTASGPVATVGGGSFNTANGPGATVGGGYWNTTSGWYATVPGGFADTAAGDYSFAAGEQVVVTEDADHTFAFGRNFTTSTPNAVIFHNSVDDIKVGIGTANPTGELTVQGDIRLTNATGNTLCLIDSTEGGHGGVWTYDSDGNELCRIGDTWGGSGAIGTFGPNGNVNVMLSDNIDNRNNGYISVLDTNGLPRADMFVDPFDNNGVILTRGPNGNDNVRLTNFSSYVDHGLISVDNELGDTRAEMSVGATGFGQVNVYGPDGHHNVSMGAWSWVQFPNWGSVRVYGTGWAEAGMDVLEVDGNEIGIVWAGQKSFRMANPNQPGTDIWYTCPEGPEAAAYIRGTGHLVNGRAEVAFPEHFKTVISPEGITVQLTPLSAKSTGLAVVEKSVDRLVVRELGNGDGTYDFDYMVMAVRKGYEDYQVIRPTLEMQPVEAEAGAIPR